jgi:hypothetical protein
VMTMRVDCVDRELHASMVRQQRHQRLGRQFVQDPKGWCQAEADVLLRRRAPTPVLFSYR